jgi:hypothetical protein
MACGGGAGTGVMDERAMPVPRVRIEAILLDHTYCAETAESEIVSARLRVRVRATNTGDEKLILAKHPEAGSARVAIRALQTGQEPETFAYEMDDLYVDGDRLSLSDKPDPDVFTVISPGETLEVEVRAVVLARRRGVGLVPRTVPTGVAFAFEVPIQWWTPFGGASIEQLRALARRWRPEGSLIIGTSVTPWLEARLAEPSTPMSCDVGDEASR